MNKFDENNEFFTFPNLPFIIVKNIKYTLIPLKYRIYKLCIQFEQQLPFPNEKQDRRVVQGGLPITRVRNNGPGMKTCLSLC